MKKASRFLSLTMATILTTTMFSTMAFAENAKDDTISGGSTVKEATLNVVVPTSLSVVLDPLQLTTQKDTDSAKNQLVQHDFFILNKSNADVLVAFGLYFEKGTDVVLVPTAAHADISQTDVTKNTVADKKMYLGTRTAIATPGLKKYSDDSAATIAPDTDLTTVYAGYAAPNATTTAATNRDVVTIDGTAADVKLAFLLDKATYAADGETVTALGAKSMGAFQLYAEMAPYAPWEADDVKVIGAYTLTALNATGKETVAGASDANMETTALQGTALTNASLTTVLPTGAFTTPPTAGATSADVTFAVGATTASVASVNKATGVKVLLADKPATITSVTHSTSTSSTYTYTYNATTGLLTITTFPNNVATVVIKTSGSTYNLTYTSWAN